MNDSAARRGAFAAAAFVAVALITVGCQRANKIPLESISETSIASDLEPYLVGGRAVLTVDIDKSSLLMEENVLDTRATAMLLPSLAKTERVVADFASGNTRTKGLDLNKLQKKYPEIFRLQDCSQSLECEFRRLAAGRWLIIVVAAAAYKPGFFEREIMCWVFPVSLELTKDEERTVTLTQNDAAIFSVEGKCLDH